MDDEEWKEVYWIECQDIEAYAHDKELGSFSQITELNFTVREVVIDQEDDFIDVGDAVGYFDEIYLPEELRIKFPDSLEVEHDFRDSHHLVQNLVEDRFFDSLDEAMKVGKEMIKNNLPSLMEYLKTDGL